MNDCIYSHIIEAKDKNLIPVCKNEASGQEMCLHSKYNPVREAENFASQVVESSFFVVLGLGAGYHIQKLSEKFPQAKILVVEISDDAIAFLQQIPCVRSLSQNPQIHLSAIQNLETNLLSIYKPALHGNLSILSLRAWETLFVTEAAHAHEKINSTVKLLSGDYSVQSHFGKIWQKNILSNLKLSETIPPLSPRLQERITGKIAAVIAAGPSLDKAVFELAHHRETYFIIATDTAYAAFAKQNIISDAVVSIDGQMISHEHFLAPLSGDTIFVFDLCAPSSSVRKALRFSKNVLLIETGHPLSQYASFFDGFPHFPHLAAGSGTVTIAAASFAQFLGFPNDKIMFFGADFSYIDGKPYARGTYLERAFYSQANRFDTAEKSYTRLMYRTPVTKISENKITTDILDSYRLSLSDFMKRTPITKNKIPPSYAHFDFQKFKTIYRKELQDAFQNKTDYNEDAPIITTMLPLLAKIGKGSAFLAYLKILEYTK